MDSRSDQVRIRLPNGDHAWVTPETFNLLSEREFQDSHRLRRLKRQRNIALALAALALLTLGVGALAMRAQLADSDQASVRVAAVAPPPTSRESLSKAAAEEEPALQTGAPTQPTDPAQVAGREASGALEVESSGAPEVESSGAIEAVVRAWAEAWAAQDVEAYLDFYAASFEPPAGVSRSAWEQRRRERILGPERIAVTIIDVAVDVDDLGSAIARFGQGYRSPGYQDWVLKTLQLVPDSGRWRILGERSSLIEKASAASAAEPAS